MPHDRNIRLRGAREHNLAGVDLDLPLGRWIAVTGPSGSGKTSLVFDTLVREGERRFLGSLSARARHFFGKLGRSDVASLEGLPATIAVGQKATTPNARSTVGTLTGTLDLLRLAFARLAVDPGGVELTRSHFSFNHPVGQCETCRGIGLEDRVDPAKIIADSSKSIRDGALVPTLKNGYTVYSQVTLEVMNRICEAHGFDVDTAWEALNSEQRHVIMHGTRALKVPFGKHSIESRMKWEGITARPREEGYYLGLVPVIEETLKRNRNENILRFVSSGPCTICEGTRLARPGREALLGTFTLPSILALPVATLIGTWHEMPNSATWTHLLRPLEERVRRLVRLGLGHLSLDRISTSLSGGEAQRVRLAAQLGAGLSGVLFALDEPTLGLHPESQEGMREVLDELVEAGNSLVVVEHDPDMVRHADHVVALGPGAGTEGGIVVTNELQPKSDRASNPLGGPPGPKVDHREAAGTLTLTGATLHNLEGTTLTLGLGVHNVVIGPSGAGKSSLVFGTLLPALSKTNGGPFESLTFDGGGLTGPTIQAVDARPIGKTPRSTPATWCGLFDIVRKRFGALAEAKQRKLTASHFSFNNKRGRCVECEGLGVTRLGLHLFEDVELTCAACDGSRYNEEVLAVTLDEKSIAEVLALTFREASSLFASDKEPKALCDAMVKLGLGYLTLGQSSGTLSRGEAQRIKLGTLLGSKRKAQTIVLLDEPDRGLSPTDVEALLAALNALVEAGHTVVSISHHRHVWAAADRLIEVRDGRVEHAPSVNWEALSTRRETRKSAAETTRPISLRGVRTHNLRGIDVDFPRGKLTAVCGVSGSGKSSLVFATLAAEAQARFAESLPFQVRRFMRRLPQPKLASASGLTPTLSLQQGATQVGVRSTISTQSECGPLLRLLFSRAGVLHGAPCGLTASHFSRERALGACTDCSGRGSLRRCAPELLVTHPELPIAGKGALAGTRGGAFFTESDGQHIATLMTALSAQGESEVDLQTTAWADLPESVREIALRGTGDVSYTVKWEFESKAEGAGLHEFETTWDGFCALVERESVSRSRSKKAVEWAGALGDIPCASCEGSGLTEAALATTVQGLSLPELEALPLQEVVASLQGQANAGAQAALDALIPELTERLDELVALGLGHLSLGRDATTLSTGELQRVRLASVLRSGLSGITLVLDEPTAGLHEDDVEALLARLTRFREEGNTIVIVSHRASVLRAADHLIELGPGAGDEGGTLISTSAVEAHVPPPKLAKPGHKQPGSVLVRGAHLNNLANRDFEFPLAGLVCITGVSGSGKTSLAFDVLAASVQKRRAIGCDTIEIPGGFEHFVAVHDTRSRSRSGTALSRLNIAGEVAALFQSSEFKARAFKPGDSAGRCGACRGTGRERVAMDFLADLDLACEACGGTRFRAAILKVRWRGKNIAEVLDAPAASLLRELRELASGEHKKLIAALEALEEVAAAHISLGRPYRELSGGEAARVNLAANLLHAESPALYVFDEPSTGLHESDLVRVIGAFRKLSARGDLVIATEHRASVIAAADCVLRT